MGTVPRCPVPPSVRRIFQGGAAICTYFVIIDTATDSPPKNIAKNIKVFILNDSFHKTGQQLYSISLTSLVFYAIFTTFCHLAWQKIFHAGIKTTLVGNGWRKMEVGRGEMRHEVEGK